MSLKKGEGDGAREGGLPRLPTGGWWERKKQLPLYPFLPVQPLHATQSPLTLPLWSCHLP